MGFQLSSVASLLIRPGQLNRNQFRSGRLRSAPDEALRELAAELRDGLDGGLAEHDIARPMFALVQEAVRRCLGLELRRNQLETGWHVLQRRIAELPTGEGKTLAIAPALAVRALAGRGVWLATANDYLARRDATAISPVFDLLGLSTGFIQSNQPPGDRQRAYRCDVTYGTIREFGFDFLRDRLQRRRGGTQTLEHGDSLQRELYSLFVDEADSVLLDDARTPLIISELGRARLGADASRWSVQVGRSLQADSDYFEDPQSLQVWITESGRSRVRAAADRRILARMTLPEAYESVALAVRAEHLFLRNRDYVVREGKLVTIDRSTGRLSEGREWQDGIQQMLQAGNDLEITPQTRPVAKVTVQRFVQEFQHLSGMTGTACESSRELARVYRLRTKVVPPHRPCLRRESPPQVFRQMSEKWSAVVSAVRNSAVAGRPVLIGTRDLDASEELSRRLQAASIPHQVLTANQEAEEASLIAQAGRKGMVTVSTNIAGRGTDIQLEAGVAELGGLHVIAADLFDAARIDRQLAGRGGRQGSPATYQRILSLEDGILAAAWDDAVCRKRTERLQSAGSPRRFRQLRSAQQLLERRHTQSRYALLETDQARVKRQAELGFNPFLDEVES